MMAAESRRARVTKPSGAPIDAPWSVTLFTDGAYVESHGAESWNYAMACANDWTTGGIGWE